MSVGLSNKELWRFNYNHFLLAESHDPVTELTIVNMLHYSLEHADKNLPHKRQIAKKVWFISIISALLFFLIGSFHKRSTVETSTFSFEWQIIRLRCQHGKSVAWYQDHFNKILFSCRKHFRCFYASQIYLSQYYRSHECLSKVFVEEPHPRTDPAAFHLISFGWFLLCYFLYLLSCNALVSLRLDVKYIHIELN